MDVYYNTTNNAPQKQPTNYEVLLDRMTVQTNNASTTAKIYYCTIVCEIIATRVCV